MKPIIFKDREVQAQFDRDGYVIIDFISAEEAKIIADKFYELHPVLPKGFYADAYSPDDELKKDIFEHTEKIFQKVVAEKFQDFKKLGSTFLCKAPGEEGNIGVHQDWTVVDESNYYSATIWVPTSDTNEENGALRVLPGSHLFFDFYRSNNIPVCYKGNEDLLWEYMITVPMKAGQAFILNHAVMHGSSVNKTTHERLAIAYGIIPKEAKLMFYHKDKNEKGDKIKKYEVPDDFFQRYYNVGDRPLIGNLVKTFDYPIPIVDRLKIRQLLEQEKKEIKLPSSLKHERTEKDVAEPKIITNELKPEVRSDNRGLIEKYSIWNIARELKKGLFK